MKCLERASPVGTAKILLGVAGLGAQLIEDAAINLLRARRLFFEHRRVQVVARQGAETSPARTGGDDTRAIEQRIAIGLNQGDQLAILGYGLQP